MSNVLEGVTGRTLPVVSEQSNAVPNPVDHVICRHRTVVPGVPPLVVPGGTPPVFFISVASSTNIISPGKIVSLSQPTSGCFPGSVNSSIAQPVVDLGLHPVSVTKPIGVQCVVQPGDSSIA
mmetsp:Transcript_35121/g.80098  ORF Transcript_35121/g.80098 Transcript_35121/m.80098 type:complete len:122 (-) Transcript_35121:288-653(-)